MKGNLVLELLEKERPVIVGHRGAAGLALENSRSAIRLALSLGVRLVEIDVRMTADDRVVVFHDEDLRRLAGIWKRVREATLSELKSVKIGEESILTLEEALEEIAGKCGLLIEIKERGMESRVIDIVREADAVAWTALISFHSDVIKNISHAEKDIPTGLISYSPQSAVLSARSLGASIVLPYYPRVTKRHIEQAHGEGLRVIGWTVNDPIKAERLIEMDIDGIATDFPDLLLRMLKERSDTSTV